MKFKHVLSASLIALGVIAAVPAANVWADAITDVPYVNEKETAAEGLSDQQKLIFAECKKQIREIAAGDRDYGILKINVKNVLGIDVTDNKYNFSLGELGLTRSDFDEDGNGTIKADAAWQQKAESYRYKYFDYYTTGGWKKLNHALWNECAYDLYWQDRTVQGMASWPITVVLKKDGSVGLDENSYIPVACSVTSAYASDKRTDDIFCRYYGTDSNGNSKAPKWDIDVTKTKAAAIKTVTNAKKVVEAAKDLSDYEKLEYYRDYILSQVTYDNEAAKYIGKDVELTDPWQVNYVFDDDPNTNIVCEGYAKAFKFLCDMTSFTDPTLDVKIVTGPCSITTNGSTQSEDHMWNVVMMNGKNYIVDLTNSDEGTAGIAGNLFMVPANKGYNGSSYSVSGIYYNSSGEEGQSSGRISWSAKYEYDATYNDTYHSSSLEIAAEAEHAFDDPEAASAYVAQQMKARRKQIMFSYTGSTVGLRGDAFKDILEGAYEHTGEAGLGDNLKRQISEAVPATANHVIIYNVE